MAEGVVKFSIGAQTVLLSIRPDGDEKPDELSGESERLARACRCALKSQHDSLKGKTATIIEGFTLDDGGVAGGAARLKKRLGPGE